MVNTLESIKTRYKFMNQIVNNIFVGPQKYKANLE